MIPALPDVPAPDGAFLFLLSKYDDNVQRRPPSSPAVRLDRPSASLTNTRRRLSTGQLPDISPGALE